MNDHPTSARRNPFRSLRVLVAASIFVSADFLLVAAPSTWWPSHARARVRAALLGPPGTDGPLPPAESVFVVSGPSAPRLIRADTGTFEDWELPLASRTHAIYSLIVTPSSTIRGVWSPLWSTRARTIEITNITTGAPADAQGRALAARVYADDLADRGIDPVLIAALMSSGRVQISRIAPLGLLNDAMVLSAMAVIWASLGAIPDARARRRAALLLRGLCPYCRYELGGLGRCPECGRELPR